MYAVIFLACVAIAAGFGPGGQEWCTCRPKCRFGEYALDKKCRLNLQVFPLHFNTCCKWLPWWATDGYGGYGAAGYGLGYGALGGAAGGAFFGGPGVLVGGGGLGGAGVLVGGGGYGKGNY